MLSKNRIVKWVMVVATVLLAAIRSVTDMEADQTSDDL